MAMTETPMPRRIRPLGVRVAAYVGAGTLVTVSLGIWFAFDAETRGKFTFFELATIFVLTAGVAAAGYALTRSRIDLRDEGIVVVNGYKRRDLSWTQVLAVHLDRGSPWAVLDLSDGTSVSAMAIQASDGGRAVRHVKLLRRLVAEHSRTANDN